jgi:heme/copper-type cytochrome/quinol oxidase subunit 1
MAAPALSLSPSAAAVQALPEGVARRITVWYLGTAVVMFLVMGLMGLTMRAEQAGIVSLTPQQFYAILTLHGTISIWTSPSRWH